MELIIQTFVLGYPSSSFAFVHESPSQPKSAGSFKEGFGYVLEERITFPSHPEDISEGSAILV